MDLLGIHGSRRIPLHTHTHSEAQPFYGSSDLFGSPGLSPLRAPAYNTGGLLSPSLPGPPPLSTCQAQGMSPCTPPPVRQDARETMHLSATWQLVAGHSQDAIGAVPLVAVWQPMITLSRHPVKACAPQALPALEASLFPRRRVYKHSG